MATKKKYNIGLELTDDEVKAMIVDCHINQCGDGITIDGINLKEIYWRIQEQLNDQKPQDLITCPGWKTYFNS